ncbi:DUF4190 domain-containing protein [Streptomyces sp. NPDC050095]|uniref:DUF4190 domain-containing protein n=1 Tax=unclassified Streptomyces TaxID=2593676 RepID=UPI00342D7EF5
MADDSTPQGSDPWAPPSRKKDVHEQQTVTSMPQTPLPPQTPYAAAPAAVPVPPPPVSPAGPGLPSYGAYVAPGGQQGYAYPPQQAAYGWPGGGMQMPPSNGLGTTGMVTGIVSVATFMAWPAAIVLGILGIVFGAIGRSKAKRGEATNGGQALAGIICGSIGLALAVGFFGLIIWSAGRG